MMCLLRFYLNLDKLSCFVQICVTEHFKNKSVVCLITFAQQYLTLNSSTLASAAGSIFQSPSAVR